MQVLLYGSIWHLGHEAFICMSDINSDISIFVTLIINYQFSSRHLWHPCFSPISHHSMSCHRLCWMDLHAGYHLTSISSHTFIVKMWKWWSKNVLISIEMEHTRMVLKMNLNCLLATSAIQYLRTVLPADLTSY